MSEFLFFLQNLWDWLLVVWRWIISNGDAIQWITSCAALYYTYKLFLFTRKKPQINLEYSDGKRLLKNVGDSLLTNTKMILLDIKIADSWIWRYAYEDCYWIQEGLKSNCLSLRDKSIPLYDIWIWQLIEINKIFFDPELSSGYSIYNDKGKINKLYWQYQDSQNEDMQRQENMTEEESKKELEESQYEDQQWSISDEIEDEIKYFCNAIKCLEIKITWDWYNQTIKYMR